MSASNSIQSSQGETIGKRISRLRSERGWTQQMLASRLAMSRVAVSHIEMDLVIPSERTVVLLSGIFRLDPFELVEGTTYPLAKTERLPEVSARYTQLELDLELFKNDMNWLDRLGKKADQGCDAIQLLKDWQLHLMEYWDRQLVDQERKLIQAANEAIVERLKGMK